MFEYYPERKGKPVKGFKVLVSIIAVTFYKEGDLGSSMKIGLWQGQIWRQKSREGGS